MTARDRRLMNPAALQTAGPNTKARPTGVDPPPSGSSPEPITERSTTDDAEPWPGGGRSAQAQPGQGQPVTTSKPAPVYTTRAEVEGLGVSLGPALHDACGDRLGDIEWFRSPWQRSGAATGFTTWRLPNGEIVEAVVKVPVGYTEYFWTTQLGEVDPMWWHSERCRHLPVPRVLARGTELGGYDVAWIVIERVSGGPISGDMSPENLDRLFAAAATFHKMTGDERPAGLAKPRPMPDWPRLLDRAAESCVDNRLEHQARWLRAIDDVRSGLPRLVEIWNARKMDTWCHGDLHPGNVIIRCDQTCPDDRCGVLIDLALVHPGHWVEDALYLERMYWGRESQLGGVEPVEALARHRRSLGLHADDLDHEIANVRRVLMGVTSPAFLSQERSPTYLEAAVGRVEGLHHLFR